MGMGDVKMMFAVGALLGWRMTLTSLILGVVSGAVIGVIAIVADRKKDMQAMIPFGIFLGIGSLISLFCGEQLISWYLTNFIPR
jgi:prepilin signal peptidase PulO-like enzyme (type II secretory pathway)